MRWILETIARLLADRPGEPRRHRAATLFFFLTACTDFLMIAGGLAASVLLRETARQRGWTTSPEASFVGTHFFLVLAYYCTALFIAFKYVDVYRERRFLTGNRETGRILKSIFAFVAVNSVLGYLLHTLIIPSRLTIAFSFFFCSAFVLLGRHLIQKFRETLRERGFDIRIAIIIGDNPTAHQLARELIDTSRHGYRLVGFLNDSNETRIEGIRVFGSLNRLERVLHRLRVDEVFLCEPAWKPEQIMQVFSRLKPLETHIRLVSPLFNIVIERVGVPVDSIASVPILDFSSARRHPLRNIFKRVIDIVLAFLAFTLFLPLSILIGLAILLDAGRPIFFRQTRVGEGGRHFGCLKFRSMVTNADTLKMMLNAENEINGPMFKIQHDPRITRVGKILRKYSLDEIPQFWNILKGDMSFVGPRPPLPEEVDEYDEWHKKRLRGPMGLTGLWQVSGRNELDFVDMALLDIYYLRNHSLFLDYRIAIRTLFTVLLGQGK